MGTRFVLHSLIAIGFAIIALCVFVSATVVTGASSQVSFYEATLVSEIDRFGETIEYIDEQYVGTVSAGDSIQLDFTKSYVAYVESDAVPFEYAPKGELYYVPNSELSDREYVAIVGGFEVELFTLQEEGVYQTDVHGFYNPFPQPVQGPVEKFFAELLGVPKAHAQTEENPDIFLETIEFTISDSNAPADCCSNVLFIPGIKGSVLKLADDTLWPPTVFSDDVPQLALNDSGESINTIVVDGVLDNFPVGPLNVPVYSGFTTFMDDIVADGIIAGWEPMPYDWRFTPAVLLTEGIQTESGVVDVIDMVQGLADESDTKQITIVAHSMGGLVGKAVIKELEKRGLSHLIDAFIMVGSPQLGTPQAVASLLHGDGEGIPEHFGFIVNPVASRVIAQNMQTAFDLLPSATYFNRVTDPVIRFHEDAGFTEDWRNYWGNSINSYSAFREFVTGTGVSRIKPLEGALSVPEILRDDLMQASQHFHDEYDEYVFPEHIRVVQIAGWGVPTAKGIEYRTEHFFPSYRVLITGEGDGTVVYSSSGASKNQILYFNADAYLASKDIFIGHKDLLNATPVQTIVESLLTETTTTPEFISTERPDPVSQENKLLVSAHSPILLGVYDEAGNFTGINPDQDGASELLAIAREIPGSYFHTFGTSQQIFLPLEGTYRFVYQGTGSGSTTVEVGRFEEGDTQTTLVTFTDIPTSPATKASFIVDTATPQDVVVDLDKDGDGTVDEEVSPDGTSPLELPLEELLALLRTEIEQLQVPKYVKRSMLNKVRILEKTINARLPFLHKLLGTIHIRALRHRVQLMREKEIVTSVQAESLLKILDRIKISL